MEGLLLNGDVVWSVTLAGAFVPAPWVTGGKTLAMDEVKLFYAHSDFHDMAKLGVNAVQIPVPCDAFYIKGNEVQATITRLLDRATNAGLDVGLHGTVTDVASSDSLTDRMKMFYHESLVCMDRSPIEWLECY